MLLSNPSNFLTTPWLGEKPLHRSLNPTCASCQEKNLSFAHLPFSFIGLLNPKLIKTTEPASSHLNMYTQKNHCMWSEKR